jgi:hypothetical protein
VIRAVLSHAWTKSGHPFPIKMVPPLPCRGIDERSSPHVASPSPIPFSPFSDRRFGGRESAVVPIRLRRADAPPRPSVAVVLVPPNVASRSPSPIPFLFPFSDQRRRPCPLRLERRRRCSPPQELPWSCARGPQWSPYHYLTVGWLMDNLLPYQP